LGKVNRREEEGRRWWVEGRKERGKQHPLGTKAWYRASSVTLQFELGLAEKNEREKRAHDG